MIGELRRHGRPIRQDRTKSTQSASLLAGSPEEGIARIADNSGKLGVQLADVAGSIDRVSEMVAGQARIFKELEIDSLVLRERNGLLASEAEETLKSTDAVANRVATSRVSIADALLQVSSLIGWVASTSEELERLSATMSRISEVVDRIDRIARQTHIIALNARIEATRYGDGGRGFGVIADSVRDLSDETILAARRISETLAPLTQSLAELGSSSVGIRSDAASTQEAAGEIIGAMDKIHSDVADVKGRVSTMAEASSESKEKVEALSASMETLLVGVEESSDELDVAKGRVNRLLLMAEGLLQDAVKSGTRTVDTDFVLAAIDTAKAISEVFETGIRDGRITLDSLFDSDYQKIPGTNPVQFMTRNVAFTDSVLPPIQERALELSPLVIFAVAIDRNAFVPTHNKKVSQPQRDDPVWNASNSRNRRIFDDRAGLASAKNQEPFLLQTYRRDMGGGNFVLLKEACAPIIVKGRHWGGFRLGYTTG
ncbi:MAG: methyl-accepting chemotaxis protein [Ferrimicrobium sp.]